MRRNNDVPETEVGGRGGDSTKLRGLRWGEEDKRPPGRVRVKAESKTVRHEE